MRCVTLGCGRRAFVEAPVRACVRLQIFVLLTGGPIPLYASGALDDGEVIVRGTIPRCKPLSDDPQDALVPPLSNELITIVPDGQNGGFRFVPNLRDGRPQVKASPDLWLRSGAKLANFTFRVPKDGTPLCIGLKPGHSSGQAKIMKIMDAMPFACRFVRFSLFVAARKADGVIWLNGGFHGNKNAGAYNTYAAVVVDDTARSADGSSTTTLTMPAASYDYVVGTPQSGFYDPYAHPAGQDHLVGNETPAMSAQRPAWSSDLGSSAEAHLHSDWALLA